MIIYHSIYLKIITIKSFRNVLFSGKHSNSYIKCFLINISIYKNHNSIDYIYFLLFKCLPLNIYCHIFLIFIINCLPLNNFINNLIDNNP